MSSKNMVERCYGTKFDDTSDGFIISAVWTMLSETSRNKLITREESVYHFIRPESPLPEESGISIRVFPNGYGVDQFGICVAIKDGKVNLEW